MSSFYFLKFVMNFLKGVVSICHGVRNTGQPGQIDGFERYFQAFKLSIDLQLGAIELVTRVLGKTNFKVLSAPLGEAKTENIYHCPNVCESCGQIIRTNLFNNK